MVFFLIVGGVIGVIYVVHRVQQKAAQLEARAEIARGLTDLTTGANSAEKARSQTDLAGALAGLAAAAQKGSNLSAAEQLKSQLAQLATAAQDPKTRAALRKLTNKLAAVTATQSGQNPNNAVSAAEINKDLAAIAAAAKAVGEGPDGNSQGGIRAVETTGANLTGATKGKNGSMYAAIDAVMKQVDGLERDAPDSKTWAALSPLTNKLDQLSEAAEGNRISPDDLNKQLADISAAAAKLTPAIVAATDAALTPPPVPSGPPMVPVAGTGDPKHDWPLEYERTVGGPEADLVVRTGDINNLDFGWPSGFDPFSGKSTPAHPFPNPYNIPPNAPPGTDRIMIGTGVTPVHMHLQHIAGKLDRIMVDSAIQTKSGDGYSWALDSCYALRPSVPSTFVSPTGQIKLPPKSNYSVLLWADTRTAASCTRARTLTMPASIVLDVGKLPSKINSVVVQIFADDFQAPVYGSHFQISLNGTRIPSFEYAINALDQSGPIGKLVTMRLLPEYWPLLKSGTVKLLIDDPTTHVQDGYAVDFVRILVNPHKFKYQVSLTATVTDADTHKPITGATVSAGLTSTSTDRQGKCELKGIPAGLVVATANAPGYDENSVPVDLPSGQSGNADIQLHRHQESTAALEQSIAQTGTATIYGIHFDTGSPKFRPDSLPALNAVLGLINHRPGSKWVIAGHTDNRGSDRINIPLSKARAASVIAWLTAHGVAANRLEPQGFGSTRPVADNSTANGRFLNRRVEVSLAK